MSISRIVRGLSHLTGLATRGWPRNEPRPDLCPDLGPDLDLGPDVDPGLGPDVDPGLGPDVDPGLGPDVDPGLGPDVDPGLDLGQLTQPPSMPLLQPPHAMSRMLTPKLLGLLRIVAAQRPIPQVPSRKQ
jgi:hypothetical protein